MTIYISQNKCYIVYLPCINVIHVAKLNGADTNQVWTHMYYTVSENIYLTSTCDESSSKIEHWILALISIDFRHI